MQHGTMLERGTERRQPGRSCVGCAALALAALAALGCDDKEECEKARLEASRAWQTVTEQAGQAKLKGWIGFDDLTEEKKAEHVKLWGTTETQAGMVASSFAYQRITWKTADPARDKANETFNGYFAKNEFTIFTAALKTANEKYEAASKLCRK